MDIYVGNLPTGITGNELREVFELFGRVETVDVVPRWRDGESVVVGLVGMPTRSEGVCAMLGVHGRNMSGQTVIVAEIRPRDPDSGICHTRCRCRAGR